VDINRAPVASIADYRAAMARLKAGDNVVFRVMRRSAQGDRFLTSLLGGVVPENQ
jgi:hypothetical protein